MESLFSFEEFFQASEVCSSENYPIQSKAISYCFLFAITLIQMSHSVDQIDCDMNYYVLLASSSDSART